MLYVIPQPALYRVFRVLASLHDIGSPLSLSYGNATRKFFSEYSCNISGFVWYIELKTHQSLISCRKNMWSSDYKKITFMGGGGGIENLAHKHLWSKRHKRSIRHFFYCFFFLQNTKAPTFYKFLQNQNRLSTYCLKIII